MRLFLIIALAASLSACGLFRSKPQTTSATPAPTEQTAEAPKPADGLWAILDRGCPKPSAADVQAWPSCASPVWITHGKAVVVHSNIGRARGLTDVTFTADYSLAPGDPVIAQVGTEKDGYVFVALTDLAMDANGRLIGASGAAVACPKAGAAGGGGLSLKPSLNGCDAQSMETVRQAALEALQDRADLSTVSWIAAGAPEP
jgi:hypothetical protein